MYSICIVIFALLFHMQTVYADDSIHNSVYDYFDQESEAENETESINNVNAEEKSNSSVGVTFMDIMRTILVLCIVIGLLIALLKWMQKKSYFPHSDHLIKNLGGTPLGGNRSIQLIKVGRSIFIVGVGENVQLLKEVTDEKEISQLLKQYDERLDRVMRTSNLVTIFKEKLEKNSSMTGAKQQSSFKQEIEKRMKEIEMKRKEAMEEHVKKGSNEK